MTVRCRSRIGACLGCWCHCRRFCITIFAIVDFPRYSCVVNDSASSVSTREELRNVLADQRNLIDRLLEGVDDPAVSAVRLAHWAEWLERLDDRRDALIQALREEATELRKREEERSVRQFVLRALDELEQPQNAGFLQDYVWAQYGVDLDTRGFGALRRDERRSWDRNPGRRRAYIVPTLDEDGRPLARWMARSDWALQRRITPAADGGRLLDLHKIRALSKARLAGERQDEPGDPLGLLIEKYARDIFGSDLVVDEDLVRREARIAGFAETADAEFSRLVKQVADAQQAAAARLAERPEEEQLWGSSGRGRSSDKDGRVS
jgi:hypothetical protein